jgi:hypothetical protein
MRNCHIVATMLEIKEIMGMTVKDAGFIHRNLDFQPGFHGRLARRPC